MRVISVVVDPLVFSYAAAAAAAAAVAAEAIASIWRNHNRTCISFILPAAALLVHEALLCFFSRCLFGFLSKKDFFSHLATP